MIAAGKHIIHMKQRGAQYHLYPLGDIHLGAKGCAYKLFKQTVAEIAADPLALWLGMGDYADFIGPSDKRWDADTVTPGIPLQSLAYWGEYMKALVVDALKPIKDKCVGMLYGNHEDKYEIQHSQRLHHWMVEELGVRDLGYSCLLDIAFKKRTPNAKNGPNRTYRIFAHHGAGAAQSPGGRTNRLVRFMEMYPYADLVLIGHLHEQDAKSNVYTDADRNCLSLVHRTQLGVFTGSYLKTYDDGAAGYGEKRGYRPVPLGTPRIDIRPFERDGSHRQNSISVTLTA